LGEGQKSKVSGQLPVAGCQWSIVHYSLLIANYKKTRLENYGKKVKLVWKNAEK